MLIPLNMFGLKHCIYYDCAMNGSNSYDESLGQSRYLCLVCLRKLSTAIGFKVADWLSKMKAACAELGFAEDVLFYERVSALKQEGTFTASSAASSWAQSCSVTRASP